MLISKQNFCYVQFFFLEISKWLCNNILFTLETMSTASFLVRFLLFKKNDFLIATLAKSSSYLWLDSILQNQFGYVCFKWPCTLIRKKTVHQELYQIQPCKW